MNNNNLFIPINNQYKKIDLLSLKLNNYKKVNIYIGEILNI